MSPPSSCQSFRRLAGIGAALGVLILSAGWIDPAPREDLRGALGFWRVGIPRAIAVRGGRATFRVPTRGPASQTLVVVSALSRGRGPFPIALNARPVTTAAIPEPADDGPRRRPWPDVTPRSPVPEPPARFDLLPPHDRTFHLMVRGDDPGSSGNYESVRGVLQGVGRRVQVYVAAEDVGRVAHETIEDLITTFDDQVYPRACADHAAARDVDGDGRFTVLLSSWLDRLGGGRMAVDGFVKVADLDETVPAPFGNRCDMMYLSTALTSGAYLRTVLAHEYMHAVLFTVKTLEHSDATGSGPEEEGWLDEAIAHLAEDRHSFSPANIDYRVSAFLSSPERYRLVVDDYFAANLFRSHGNRGSTYLFLRWCVDRFGPDLIPRLVRSPLRGVSNIEAVTGCTFAELYRRWSLALFRSGPDPANPAADDGFRSINLHAPWNGWELAGPRYQRIRPGDPADCWDALGTSSHYVLVDGAPAGAVEVEVVGPPGAQLQVTALPMGEDRARMTLSVWESRGREGKPSILAHVVEHDGIPVRLSALSWEPKVPGTRPRDDDPHRGRINMLGIAAAFGTPTLPGGGELTSQPIALTGISPATGPLVVKVIGTDPRGRRIAAWAELDAFPSVPPADR